MLYWQDAMRSSRLVRLLAHCALFALLSACQPNGSGAALETWLANRLAPPPVVSAAPESTRHPQPPKASQLQLAIPSGNLAQLDFLALSGCAVQANIIKRDTSLARHAKPSQRLLLELEYLQLAPSCIAQLRDNVRGNVRGNIRSHNNNVLADRLEAAGEVLREQLPSLIFNATLGSDEYQAFWNVTPAPGEYPRVSHGATVAALTAINEHTRRWLGGDYRAHNREFELLLTEVAGGDGGALWWALLQQAETSTAADSAEALRYGELLALITQLEEQVEDTLPERYLAWMNDRNALK